MDKGQLADPACTTCEHKGCAPDRWPCMGCIGGMGRFLRWADAPHVGKPEGRGDDMQSPTIPGGQK